MVSDFDQYAEEAGRTPDKARWPELGMECA
jgi:hypothetical protein